MAKKPIKVQNRIKKSSANSQWFQNVAKSMGFTAADLVKDLMPNTNDFLSYNSADAMNMLSDMRTRASSRQMLTRQFKNIPQIKAAEKAMENIKADLMSGNFNNKTREKEYDFDDDMDYGFGDFSDGGVEFIDNEETPVNQTHNTTVINNLPLAKVIHANTEATVDTMINIAEQQMAIESEKLLFNHKSTNSILGGLGSINDNLATLVKFNAESTAKYHAASIKFYEESLELLKKSNNTSNNDINNENDLFGGLYTYNGAINLKQYKKIVSDNIKELRNENTMMSEFLDNFKDPMVLNKIAKNPIGTITSISLKTMIPTAIKASLKAVDDSISSIMPTMLSKLNSLDGNDNPILDKLYKVFGSKNKLSYDVDLSKYEKGAISWDGESKKALTEVIPGYLRRIESALTGQEERMYNYSTGKFTNASNMKKEYDKSIREKETSGYLETRHKLLSIAQGMNPNKDTMKQFEKDMDKYLSAMTKKGSVINPFASIDKDGNKIDELADLFGGNNNRTQMLRNALKGLSMSELAKMATSQLYQSRQETQKLMDDIRKNPTMSGYALLNNNGYYGENGKLSYDPTKKPGSRDKFGLSSLDYLRDIRQVLLNGIKVFPDHMRDGGNPNRDLIRKQRNENKKYKRQEYNKKRQALESQPNFNYDDVLNMSEKELNELYERNSDTAGNKLGFLTNVIDKQLYSILFGVQKETGTRINQGNGVEGVLAGISMTGNKSSSIFSSTINFFNDSLKGVGSYFTGQSYTMSDGTIVPANPDSIMGKMKSFFTGSMEKLSNGKQGGLIGKVSKDFMDGFNQFKVSLFGEKKLGEIDNNETMKDLMKKIKPRLPKALGMGLGGAVVKTALASKLGLLGSIILPGGPMGAALIGTTFGFLKQSETFNKWLFGDKDKDGYRMGGFIPKSLVSLIESHGGSIKKGAIVGGATGLLTSFFLPGGPISGAIMGMGAGLLSKTDVFQEFLFGKDFMNKDNKSLMNGAFGKLYKNTIGKAAGEGTNPKLAAFLGTSGIGVGIAQGVGLLPSFLLPGGPVLGAILGLAGGITASSDKFQQFLFGDKDIDGKRYGGLMTKFTNWFDTTVMSPLKIKMTEVNDNIYKFMKEKVFNPFLDAFEPIKQAGLFLIDDAKNAFKNMISPVTDSFTEHVTKPLGDQMKKYIVDPLAKKMNSLFSLVGKVLGSVISTPMKFITGLGNMANKFNEERVLSDERKRRNARFKEDIASGFSMGKLFTGIRNQSISDKEKEDILNERLGYRKNRNNRRKNGDEALNDEMVARAQKRANMQKQYEKDMEFGRNSGWKYASKRQKDAREKELSDKQSWMQEKVATEIEETNKKIGKITSILEKGSDLSNETIDALKDIKKLLKDNLKSLGEKTGMSEVVNKLRNMGQSHAEGLDEVPKDGYIAELHEGEMVLPKGPAGLIRNMFGKNKNSGLKSLFGKLMDKDKLDRSDNSLGLSDEEENQLNELRDRQRYSNVSRKSVDFIQDMMNRRKKEKEEKKWKTDLLSNITSVRDKISEGNNITKSIFTGITDFVTGLPKLLSGLLSGLGLSGLGALAATGLGAAALNQYSNTAEEYGASISSVVNGYGREERLDADGMYIYDNQGSSSLGKFGHKSVRTAFSKPLKMGYEKIIQPMLNKGKTVYEGAKNIAQKGTSLAKKGVSKLDNFINPKITASGTSFLGTAYNYTGDVVDTSARKGIAKPIGAISDITKTATKRSKSAITTFIDGVKDALLIIQDKAVKKFPGIGSITKNLDNILSSLLKNSDEIYRKFGAKISLFLADVIADATLIGAVVEIGTTAFDIISGLTKGNIANLFGVPENQIDNEMMAISAFLHGLCKFSFISIIWLVNEITSSMMGIDFLQALARSIYTSLPINLGRKIDLSDDLKGVDIDNMSLEEAISAAGGNVSQFKDNNGKFKDITKLNNDNLDGISATEIMELQRLQYNQQNGTQLDSLAWKDKQSKTLGQKLLGNDWVKNFKGSFQQQSIKGHMGLNTDAKLTLGDRARYALGSAGVNMTNFIGKLTGNETMQNLTTETLFKDYEKKRTSKYQNKVDKANAKINEKLEQNSKTDNKLVQAWNNMIIGIQKGKRERARDKIGTTKQKSQRQLQIEAMQNQDTRAISNNYSIYEDKNSADQSLKDINMLEYEAYGMAAANMGKGEVMGKGDDYYDLLPTNPVSKAIKNKDTSASDKIKSSVNKIFNNITKTIQGTGKELAKGLNLGNKTVSKSFISTNKSLTKIAESTEKTLEKDKKSATESLVEKTKKLTKSVSETVSDMTTKVTDFAKGVKDTISEKITGISTTIKTSKPVQAASNIFDNIVNFFKGNAGSSGAKVSDNTVKTPKHTITKSDFITPANNTTTNNTTSNKFVFYNQGDSRWGGVRIGNSNLKDAGCGPTSLAMAISQMTGEQVTPDTIAQLGKEHLPGYSTYSLFPSVANKLNMNYTEGTDSGFILNNLKRGIPVLLSGKGSNINSPYTSEGHIVTASDVKGDMVFIQDPRGKEYSKYYPIQNILNGLNKSMVLSPSNRTKNLPSSGKIQGWSNTMDNKVSKYPLGIYGDIGSLELDNMNLGKSGGKVRVIDRVLSYMRSFLNQKSKFKYSQSQRDGINKNKNTADCSSFVGHVLTVAGDTPVSGTSQTMWDSIGTQVNNPQVGDIVCQQGHVGLYSGAGKYIHMSSPQDGIKESDAISKYNNPHRGYKRVLKNPNAMVDAVISGGNSLLGTVTATDSGTPVEGGSSSNTISSGSNETVDQLGVFSKLSNIGQNMIASIFNGKQVDLFSSPTDNSSSSSTSISPTTWNGTKYDLSKYNMSDLSSTKQNHINKMIHATLQTYKSHGLFPSLTIAQSAQESGWGPTSGLAKNGNAMFGIKADKSWTGKVYRSKTKEVYNGNTVTITDGFRAYSDINEGIIDRANFLAKNTRYSNAGVFTAKTPEEQARALQRAGYATDPNYANSLIKLINSSNLKRFDSPNPPVEDSAGKGPSTATSAENAPSDGSIPSSMNGWAYYQQTDPQWNKTTIDGTTVGRAGCGPSSHAMLLTSLFGQQITPDIMTDWAYKNGTWFNGGMYHTMPAKVAREFGLSLPQTWSGKSTATLNSIKAAIKSGKPVVMSGRGESNNTNTPFTTGGHIVLGIGVDGNDNIIINDPRGPQYTKAYTDYGLTKYGTGLRAAWAFEDTNSKKIPNGLNVGGSWTGSISDTTGSTGTTESVDQLGVFSKLNNIGQNMTASIFNGKQVDLFGKGDGETYWAKGFGDNKSDKVKYSGSMGKGDDVNKQFQNTRRATEKSIRQMERATNASSISISGDTNQAYIDILKTIVEELHAINGNTAATVKSISEIEIVSANEPLNSNTNRNQINSKTNNSQLRQPNSNTGYDIARQIASYR